MVALPRAVAERSVMPRALGNSLAVATLTTLVALALGLPAAYAIARLPVPGKAVLLLVIVASTAFPQIATVSPLYLLMRALGLRDTWTALVLANTSFALPLLIWLLAGFIREIPQEVEEALYYHPAVLEAGVIGMPCPVHGEKVIAFVALREGLSTDEQELRTFLRDRIADYKTPERILFLPALPKGLTGKVQRRALKDMVIESPDQGLVARA